MNKISRAASSKDLARKQWPNIPESTLLLLEEICAQHHLSIAKGDLIFLERGWYVTHTGLLRVATRRHCAGISVRALEPFCNAAERTWSFEATVYKSKTCRGFSGVGDACPTNVQQFLWGSEMRIAETRAVNRALRKAYGIGLCSVEELGSTPPLPSNGNTRRAPARLGANLEVIPPVPLRDQLRQLIRQHRLDPILTKSYALEHLGLKSLRDASREQVTELIAHLQKRLFEGREQFVTDLARFDVSAEGKDVA